MKIAFLSQEFEVSASRAVREEFFSAFEEEMKVKRLRAGVRRDIGHVHPPPGAAAGRAAAACARMARRRGLE